MRTKNSLYNSIARFFSSIIPSFLGVILSNLILKKYGADIHGLSGTIGQITVLLTLFESGYSLAANVALYKPYVSDNWDEVNAILSAVKKTYIRIGIITAFLSIMFALAGPFVIRSNLEYGIVSSLILISSVGTVSGLILLSKYSVLFGAAQKDYKLSFMYLALNILTQILSLLLILNNYGIVIIRLTTMLVNLLAIPLTVHLFRTNFCKANFDSPNPDYSIAASTKDVFAQKVASIVFSSTDMLVLSAFVGTLSTSIYVVYNMVFTFAKQILFSFILAPFNAFGQLSAEGDTGKIVDTFRIYQFLSIFISNAILTTVMIIILPFVSLYTSGVPNIDYVNVQIAVLFGLCSFLEIISNMYAVISNSAGMFSEMKIIATVGAAVNVVVSISLVTRLSVSGVLIGTLVSYVIMDAWQIYLVHFKQLNAGFPFFVKLMTANLMVSFVSIMISISIDIQFDSYLMLLLFAVAVFVLVSSILLIVGAVLFRGECLSSLKLFKEILMEKGK